MKHTRPLHTLCVLAPLLCPALAQADADTAGAESLPTRVVLGFETVRLPQGERMGLVGGSLLFDIGSDWSFGPAVYGAATGRRGGLFVGGIELQRRWQLAEGLALATGVYAGGGGGAAAEVGSGLMLRPAVTLWKDLGPSLQAGLSWSSVRFPSGQIASNQVGVVLGWRSEFVHLTGTGTTSKVPTGLGFDRISATATSYRFTDGSERRIALVGGRAERRLPGLDGAAWGLEAAAAAKGDAAGYMEILATTSLGIAPLATVLPSWRVGARLGAGLGGGGAVPTRGGVIGKAAATTQWSPTPGWTLGADYGWVLGVKSPLRARQAQVWLGIALEPGPEGRRDSLASPVRTEWVGVWQHHARTERRDGTRQPLDTIGLKLNRYLGDNLYVSGQAHSAFAGGAGAYSIGLVGAGLATSQGPAAGTAWRFGAEGLVGAAGGGGVATAGGAIVQALAWASWAPSPVTEWRAGIGGVRSLRGGLASPIAELAWSRSFGMAGR